MQETSMEVVEAYAKYLIGKPCPMHPNRTVKKGNWDLWCGGTDELGRWCNGGAIPQEFISKYERNKNDQTK